MAGDGVMEFGDWIIKGALQRNPCVKVPEFPDELTCLKMDESDASVEWRVYVPKGSECSECREWHGYYLDAETIQRQQERIAELEAQLSHEKMNHAVTWGDLAYAQDALRQRDELIRDWCELYENPDYGECIRLRKRMNQLGVEVHG